MELSERGETVTSIGASPMGTVMAGEGPRPTPMAVGGTAIVGRWLASDRSAMSQWPLN